MLTFISFSRRFPLQHEHQLCAQTACISPEFSFFFSFFFFPLSATQIQFRFTVLGSECTLKNFTKLISICCCCRWLPVRLEFPFSLLSTIIHNRFSFSRTRILPVKNLKIFLVSFNFDSNFICICTRNKLEGRKGDLVFALMN